MTRVLTAALTAALLFASPLRAFETNASAAYVVDLTTDTVLLSKQSEVPLPPASMSKLMTLYMAFEAIRDGRLTLDEVLPVSQHAMSYGGSTMFLDTTDRVKVEDLLRGIIVLSGNDACVVIAEALSPDGTEGGFARLMTQRAHEMGMDQSNFANSNGWPQVGHLMSMKDLGILSEKIIEDFPEFYPLFAEREFAFDGRAPRNVRNRNPLLGLGIGVDGLKTGHTEEAGYGLVASAVQGDRRVVFVVAGMESEAQRAEEAERIVNWAFRQFTRRTVTSGDDVLAEAEVWMGQSRSVGLVTGEDLNLLLPVVGDTDLSAEIVYQSPIPAPIEAGQQIAELVIARDGLPEKRVPLVADAEVPQAGFAGRVRTAARVVMRQITDRASEQTGLAQ
ncbi:D-alanyl-D-alanine carboxypeptidase (penicillin-binding protein 5/6) [Poseidonocella pacifica]|uniref:serine-type D-Ala-D-Ala carboxypeptidase n=1 Tax=Poseidonocella pacifica TaxID=871651 RepID=A0A1I0YU32_9RHOB|nr:D-alanyl-D-alanine carboxypeptidase family protein [Poseidonocella pacifica]SFB15798.1 D-alanyl-D-alanine carboxypeptidase (penicillin-binding protein 5/6) [Poseidonocella pacifica]